MNENYEELPEDLKKLAKNIDLPYNKQYNYIADMDIFLKYEREEKGLVGINISAYPRDNTFGEDSSNQIAYSFLRMHYSPTLEIRDCSNDFL